MQLTLRHTLRFSLGTPARAVAHLLLTPRPTPQQQIERWSIAMPGFDGAASFRDGFGNAAHLVTLARPAPELTILAEGRIETTDKAGVVGRLRDDPVPALFRRATALTKPDATLLAGLADGSDRIGVLHELMARVHGGAGAQSQSAAQSQSQSQSQESAEAGPADRVHAFLAAARALGTPARYVTGYLLDEAGAARSHAWAEAWDESLGWIGFDPALNLCPSEAHIRLAAGLDALSCPPLRTVPAGLEPPAEAVEITTS